MVAEVSDVLIQVVILDVSGIYAQIHNQGYFEKDTVEDIKKQYSDSRHWRVLVLDWYIYTININ